MARPVILLGLGFTTRRLARRLLLRGLPTFAAVRDPNRFRDLAAIGLRLEGLPKDTVLVHTIPPLPAAENQALHEFIERLEPRRVVYISSTSVYGNAFSVTETTAAQPSQDKGRRRIDEETWLLSRNWETLVVRPAAIYGPGRGVHVRVRENRPPRGEPSGITSRIHADDLASVLEFGALADLTGAWPLADDHPCPTSEIAAWCGQLLRTEIAGYWQEETPGAGRSVHGQKIRELLGVELQYPEYQSGILASLAEERAWLP